MLTKLCKKSMLKSRVGIGDSKPNALSLFPSQEITKGKILFRLGSNNNNFLKPCIQCTLKCH